MRTKACKTFIRAAKTELSSRCLCRIDTVKCFPTCVASKSNFLTLNLELIKFEYLKMAESYYRIVYSRFRKIVDQAFTREVKDKTEHWVSAESDID